MSEMTMQSQTLGASNVQNRGRKCWVFLKTGLIRKKRKPHENNVPEKVILSSLKVRSQSADKTIHIKH